MRKILLAVAAAVTLLTLTGCNTTMLANNATTANAGFGPYVAGPYETAAIQYVTLSLY